MTTNLERIEREADAVAIPVGAPADRHVIDQHAVEVVERGAWYVLRKLLFFVPAIFLFILAIQLMKEGAATVGPTIQGQFPFANGVSTLGAGWMGAYFVLSGSPVAATAISLFGAGTLTKLQTFTMLSGSRLGASFIVLLAGFLYAIRHPGRERGESIGVGIQALTMTAIVYVPGMLIGYAVMKLGLLEGVNWHASDKLNAAIGFLWGPILDLVTRYVPGGLLFPVGLAVILLSFRLLDHVLPTVDLDRQAEGKTHWLRRPWAMFLLGCLVATLTLSVSVALTVLVPLASKGIVKRDEALPYIMGANITTLADTLVVAMLQSTPVAAQIVLAEAIGVSLVSLTYLAFFYEPIRQAVIGLDDWLVASNRRLGMFVGVLFLLPVAFLLSGLIVGPVAR